MPREPARKRELPGEKIEAPYRTKRQRADEVIEVQRTRCTTPAYCRLPPCRACAAHNSREHCRFRKVRQVARAPSGKARSLETFVSGSGFSLAAIGARDGSSSTERKDSAYILKHACGLLMEQIDAEVELVPDDVDVKVATAQLSAAAVDPTVDGKSVVDRSHLEGERQLCDWCGTTIMCLYRACAHCGYEACLTCTASWEANGKPAEVEQACGRDLSGWTYFSRVEPNALDELRARAGQWIEEYRAGPRAHALHNGHARRATAGAAGAAAAAGCPACAGRHRAHTCDRDGGKKMVIQAPPVASPPAASPAADEDGSRQGRLMGAMKLLRQRLRELHDTPVPPGTPPPGPPPAPCRTPPVSPARASAAAITPAPNARLGKRAVRPTAAAAELGLSLGGTGGTRGHPMDRHACPLRLRLKDGHDEARFLAVWALGEPIVVEGCGERLRERWTPDALAAQHGDHEVPLVDIRSGRAFYRPLREFLQGFRRPDLRPTPPAANGSCKAKASAASAPSVTSRTSATGGRSAVGGRAALAARMLGSGAPSSTPVSAPGPCSPEEGLLKLKDWPASSDFKELLPRHFDDFMRALPLQRYTLRDGPLNLASTLPRWCLPPDLGPKMYLAYGGLRGDGTFVRDPASQRHVAGTCLHVDMADAVNICAHVEPLRGSTGGAGSSGKSRRLVLDDEKGGEEEGEEEEESEEEAAERRWMLGEGESGGAVWDIWRGEDAEALCAFLRQVAIEEGRPPPIHGIHDQKTYIDAPLRRRLETEAGVVGWRFVQRQGDAVFIPAGCPHQVLNLRSAIKAAMDFVSPEHIGRCLALTEQYRRLPRGHARADDPLATRAIVLHAVSHALSVCASRK